MGEGWVGAGDTGSGAGWEKMGPRMREDTEGGAFLFAGGGMGWRVRVREGRLFARTTVSVTTEPVSRKMGPRMREDTERGGFVPRPPSARGQAVDTGAGYARGHGGRRGAFLFAGGGRGRLLARTTGGEGWVAGFARITGWGGFVFAGGGYSRGQLEGRDGFLHARG